MVCMLLSHKERAYAHIREKMLTGTLEAGDKISEVTLAKEIGISRTPVREAITQLGVEGLLEQVPRYGTFVRRLDRAELQEMYELREMLEGYAAARAAERITPEQLRELQGLCNQMHEMVRAGRDERATEMPPETGRVWVLTDVAFHMLVVHASGSRRVAKIVSDFRIMTNLCGHQRSNRGQTFLHRQAGTWADHVRILRALRRRAAATAAALVAEHVRKGKVAALAHYDEAHDRTAAGDAGAGSGADWPDSVRTLIAQMERFRR